MSHDNYKKLDAPDGLVACPVCGAAAELWRYSETADSPTTTAVMCENGEQFGPQDGMANEGCLLFMPPENFYRGTIREAVKYWNEYAAALSAQRRKRGWETAKVMRAQGAAKGDSE